MTGERTIRAWPQTWNFSSSFYWPACKALNILSVLNKGGGNSHCRAGLRRRQALQQTGRASRTYKASNGFLLYFSETGIWFSLFVSKHITSPDVTYQPALFVDSSLFYQITKLRESQHHTWLGLEHLWVPLVQILLHPPCQPVQVSLDVFVPLVKQPLPLVLCCFFAVDTLYPIVYITDNVKQGWVQSLGPLLLGDGGQLLYKLLWWNADETPPAYFANSVHIQLYFFSLEQSWNLPEEVKANCASLCVHTFSPMYTQLCMSFDCFLNAESWDDTYWGNPRFHPTLPICKTSRKLSYFF